MDPEYFLDELSQDEIIEIYNARFIDDQILWERFRYIAFFSAAPKGTTYKSFCNMFPFPWEREGEAVEKQEGPRILTREQALKRMEEIKLNTKK